MPQQATALALAAIDVGPGRHDDRERAGGAAGPGWFDSSWELHRGLEVRENWSDDERVHGWIEDFLTTQRAIGHPASPSASTAIA
ncbi:MAG: hypothetical protein ABI520_01010 [Caldimonas sp.]